MSCGWHEFFLAVMTVVGMQGEGWQGTVLEPYIKAFNSSFLAPLASSSRAALNAKAKQAAAEQRGHRADQGVAW